MRVLGHICESLVSYQKEYYTEKQLSTNAPQAFVLPDEPPSPIYCGN
jgi:hypothetical protein